jgi:hypothetical protein
MLRLLGFLHLESNLKSNLKSLKSIQTYWKSWKGLTPEFKIKGSPGFFSPYLSQPTCASQIPRREHGVLFGRVSALQYAPNCASGVRPELRFRSTPRIASREYAVLFASLKRTSLMFVIFIRQRGLIKRTKFEKMILRIRRKLSKGTVLLAEFCFGIRRLIDFSFSCTATCNITYWICSNCKKQFHD